MGLGDISMGIRYMEVKPQTETLMMDNIEVTVYEPPEYDEWHVLGTPAKVAISKQSGAVAHATARNTTTVDMHEWLVGRSDPNGTTPDDITELAVGRSTTTPTESDTGLNDEVDRAPITSTSRSGDTLETKTFIDKGVGNIDTSAGESLSEVGLYAGSYFLNHAVLSNDIDKTSNKTATITVTITYGSA